MRFDVGAFAEKYLTEDRLKQYLPVVVVGVLMYLLGRKGKGVIPGEAPVKKRGFVGTLLRVVFLVIVFLVWLTVVFYVVLPALVIWFFWYVWKQTEWPVWGKVIATVGVVGLVCIGVIWSHGFATAQGVGLVCIGVIWSHGFWVQKQARMESAVVAYGNTLDNVSRTGEFSVWFSNPKVFCYFGSSGKGKLYLTVPYAALSESDIEKSDVHMVLGVGGREFVPESHDMVERKLKKKYGLKEEYGLSLKGRKHRVGFAVFEKPLEYLETDQVVLQVKLEYLETDQVVLLVNWKRYDVSVEGFEWLEMREEWEAPQKRQKEEAARKRRERKKEAARKRRERKKEATRKRRERKEEATRRREKKEEATRRREEEEAARRQRERKAKRRQALQARYGIGVSHSDLLMGLTNLFLSLDKDAPRVGMEEYDYYTKTTDSVTIWTYGLPANLVKAALIVSVPSDNNDIASRNWIALWVFVTNMVPEWPSSESSKWLTSCIRSRRTRTEIVRGNNRVVWSSDVSLEKVGVTVQHKDLPVK